MVVGGVDGVLMFKGGVEGGTVCLTLVLFLTVASGLPSVTALKKAMQTVFFPFLLFGKTSLFALC